jgi:hypothetical protein
MADDFRIPSPSWPDEEKVIAALTREFKAMHMSPEAGKASTHYAVPEKVVKAIADVATNAWKAKMKMVDNASGETRDDMKRIYRHIEAIFDSFQEMGLEIKDHTGDTFDYGLPLKVVTTQPTQGLTKETVIETIKPTIYWQKQIIQMGEVVIATPA